LSFFPSLGPDAAVRNAMTLNPAASRLLIAYHTEILRGPSPLSPAERELIAAFVSALNACAYCHGVHAATARAFGIEEAVLAELVADRACTCVGPKLQPIFQFVRKLTLSPAKMQPSDAASVFSAGWDERALHDAISVAALFNFMNRYVEGHGLSLDEADLASRGEGLMREGYAPLERWLPER
jgi:uncharacterized peroxidase-related enzyme